jgi:gamma-glutamyl-gamma-aminobutyrate hydrolase PuuD
MRIGLTQTVMQLRDRPERRDSLDQAWIHLLSGIGWMTVPIPNALSSPRDFLLAMQLDAIILTGGNDLGAVAPNSDVSDTAPERDFTEQQLVYACRDLSIPLLGICRGLQLLVHHYGGIISPVLDHVRQTHCVRFSPDFGSCTWVVNSFHKFGVQAHDLGPVLRPIAWAPDGTVEAALHPSYRQLGIMWHPERFPSDPRTLSLVRSYLEPS